MGTPLTTWPVMPERNSSSAVLPQLSSPLESANPESVEQEIRHALERLVSDVNLDDSALAAFELDRGAPRRTRVLATSGADAHTVAGLASERWIIQKASAFESIWLTGEHGELPAAPPGEAHRLRTAGVRALIGISWKTHSQKVAAAILVFRGIRDHIVALPWDRASLFAFARQAGVLLLADGSDGTPEPVAEPRTRGRKPQPSASIDTAAAAAPPEDGMVGASDAWRYAMFRVEQVAQTQATVLLLGETGTGKELVARAIHRRSARGQHRFVAVNCSALPATLIESELFGRERGAFTGASVSQPGRFELAHRGTLFLDEAGDLPLELQPKLLRVLQESQLDRLGSTRTTTVDVRVIAATNRDLMDDVRNDRFRRDLYYRLNVFPITLPALRERPEDIPILAAHFLKRFSRELRIPMGSISSPVMRALQDHQWPGNIRELENVIQRALILSSGGVISMDHVCLSNLSDPAGVAAASPETTLQAVERNHILRILSSTSWRIEGPRGAARMLGLKPSTLRSRLQKLSIRRPA
jgi:DNA-binding NtrC family response regulator